MKLEKAIEILTKWRDEGEGESEALEKAENLGIEALKRVKEASLRGAIWNHSLLSGETMDIKEANNETIYQK